MTQRQNKPVERDLLPPLIEWLRARRVVRHATLIVEEVPWRGRRVDLVTMTGSGSCSAYELKLGNTRRALEQSSLNTLSFDMSHIVVASMPNETNLEEARFLGVGVIQIDLGSGRVRVLSPGRRNSIDQMVKKRLKSKLTAGAGRLYV